MVEPAASPIIIALDFDEPAQALDLVRGLTPGSCRLKIGKELFCVAGPDLVRECHDAGFEVFLDLKFHDIPNTVAGACRAAARLGVWMVNVHASGGRQMMQAARDAVQTIQRPPLLIAVTVLTSHDQATLSETGVAGTVDEQVERLTALTLDAGLDGVVCSAREAERLRGAFGVSPLLVTPGIRPEGSARDDQTRTVTPAAALAMGADYLVIGRPVTRAENPSRALSKILASLNASSADT